MNNLLNIKSFLKFLSRNKGYTAIDVFGLSVSLMFGDPDCGVCGTGIEYRQTTGELRPDRCHRQ